MSEKYNGWATYETWLVNNHYSGDDYLTSELPKSFNSVYDYGKAIENYFDDLLTQYNECSNGFLSDMLKSAFDSVDYQDLAETYYIDYLRELVSIELLDTCYPDYFQGSSKPVINVFAHNKQTFYELETALLDALNADTAIWEIELSNGLTLADIDVCFLVGNYINNSKGDKPKSSKLGLNHLPSLEESEVYHYFALNIAE